jgi:hypothetical protein
VACDHEGQDEVRQEVLRGLSAAKAPEHWLQMVKDVASFSESDELRAIGDTLPSGLRLSS